MSKCSAYIRKLTHYTALSLVCLAHSGNKSVGDLFAENDSFESKPLSGLTNRHLIWQLLNTIEWSIRFLFNQTDIFCSIQEIISDLNNMRIGDSELVFCIHRTYSVNFVSCARKWNQTSQCSNHKSFLHTGLACAAAQSGRPYIYIIFTWSP